MTSRNGIRLPQTLLEQIGGDSEHYSQPGARSAKSRVSRKEARKQERTEKKQRKASHFTKRVAETDHPDSPQRKKAKLSAPEPVKVDAALAKPKSKGKQAEKSGNDKARKDSAKTKAKAKSRTALEKLAEGPQPTVLPRSQRDIDEERYIAFLESKLGKAKRGEFADDGLGDLLADLDTIGLPSRNQQSHAVEDSAESDLEDDEVEQDETDVSDEESAVVDEMKIDGEWTGFGNEEEGSEQGAAGEEQPSVSEEKKPATKYVPPHLRRQAADSDNSEALAKISRQLKGLLNRLSEQNIGNILDEVEGLYRTHRRNDVTSTITSLIINGISSHSMLLDSYVVLHAAFVSALHKIIGIEFAAFFLQNVVSSYETNFDALDANAGDASEDDNRGKECSNLIVLLSELYNFQVISCILIYDIIRNLLASDLTEFNVELLLKLLRNSGHQLRQDDPSALKDIVQLVQDKVSDSRQSTSSRTRFMLETLNNLKNNKTKRSATQHAGGDAVERMKKFLTGLSKKKHVLAHEPLRVGLEDLHSAETKGKWWLVGAAWGGDPLVEHQESSRRTEAAAQDVVTENALVKLARKQGMNTDIRRSIFVVLMSSDDYVDAWERLSQLNLTEVQQREIVRVILHCCGNEKSYNPYYTFVGQHLCRMAHSYKITLQFSLWDFLRDLGETTVGGAEILKSMKDDDVAGFDVKTISSTRLRNVAKAYAWWVAKDSVTLAILKPVDFLALKSQTQRFFVEFFRQLFMSSQSTAPVLSSKVKDLPSTRNRGAIEEIFIKATRIQALSLGLVYFLTEAFKKLDAEDEDAAFFKWASGVAVETLRTGMDIIPTL